MSRDEAVKEMILLHCHSIIGSLCGPPFNDDIDDACTGKPDCIETAAALAIKDIAHFFAWSAQDELQEGEKQVHFRTSAALHARDAEILCEERLVPLVGRRRAEAIANLCRKCASHNENLYLNKKDDADIDLLWMNHYTTRMGFDALPSLSGNRAIADMCLQACKLLTAIWRSGLMSQACWDDETASSVLDNLHESDDPELKALYANFHIAEAEAKESTTANVSDIIKETIFQIRRSVYLNRLATSGKHPITLVSSLGLSFANLGQTTTVDVLDVALGTLKKKLQTLLSENATPVWKMCFKCAWHSQNEEDSYDADAEADGLWMEHYVNRMGFDDDAPLKTLLSRNRVVAALIHHQCRYWTVTDDVDEVSATSERRPREAAFRIAEIEAKDSVASDIIDVIMEMTREIRLSVNLERLAGRKNPVKFLQNMITNPSLQSKKAAERALTMRDKKLRPLIGNRAEAVWNTCRSCAWCEQNRRDADVSLAGSLIGYNVGYFKDMEADTQTMEENILLMGFDAV